MFSLLHLLAALAVLQLLGAQQFNRFKSYAKERVRPKNYGSKIQRDHDIGEYLTSNQKYMMSKRNGATTADVAFGNDWSGFKETSSRTANSNTANGRRLGEEKISQSTSTSDFLYYTMSSIVNLVNIFNYSIGDGVTTSYLRGSQ